MTIDRMPVKIIDGRSYVKASDAKLMHDELEELIDKNKRLREIFSTVLEACEDVNSPDRKVREEIARTVGEALKETE